MTAKEILDAIDKDYGGHYMMIRETSILCDFSGRMDALLVPWSSGADCMLRNTGEWFWDRPRLIAIEVKVNRADFLKGLREGQYERYTNQVSGLFLAVPRPDHPMKRYRDEERVCKLKEVPRGVGLITVERYGTGIHCARRPILKDVEFERDVPWRLLFAAREYLGNERREHWAAEEKMNKRIGRAVARAVAKLRESFHG